LITDLSESVCFFLHQFLVSFCLNVLLFPVPVVAGEALGLIVRQLVSCFSPFLLQQDKSASVGIVKYEAVPVILHLAFTVHLELSLLLLETVLWKLENG
jgi:hypothetical protein